MHPKRRFKPELDPEGQDDNNRPQHHDETDRTGVTGIGLR
jgi:hypothetical protein